MPEPANEQKRRPPPVLVPSRSRPSTSSSNQSNTYSRISDTHREPRQQRQHVPSAASLPTARASPVTPPLTSFSDQDHLRMSRAESQSSRTPAHRRLADLMEQVVTDPRASSELSEAQSPTTAKTPDEKSVRGRIESRNKQSFYNMTNHAIPANISTTTVNHEVEIEVHDFRRKSQAASEEEPMRSPKKRFLGMNIPDFSMPPSLKHSASRKFGHAKKPAMPQKFAEIVGEKPRGFRQTPLRPIKPSGYNSSPTKVPRSETSKSLPAKVADHDQYARRHHTSTTRRSRGGIRKSPPRRSPQAVAAGNAPPRFKLETSVDSMPPPTPPAKDTPPEVKTMVPPSSPLRRTAPSNHLRDSYALPQEPTTELRFPAFALSPSLQSGSPVRSPIKPSPATADDYQRLVAGLPQPFPSDKTESISSVRDFYYNASAGSETVMEAATTHDDHKSDGITARTPSTGRTLRNEQFLDNDQIVLEPRYYVPPEGTFQRHLHNTNTSLHTHRRQKSSAQTVSLPLRRSNESHKGSINMIFQGHVEDIDPNSSTGQLVKDREPSKPDMKVSLEPSQRARMQELRFGEQEPQLSMNGTAGLLQPDQSSSRLTEMLNGVSPLRRGFNEDFNNPSAVPSPLHKYPGPNMQTTPPGPHRSPPGPWTPASPQAIEHQFLKMNEHLDVVGKSTWDMINSMTRDQHTTISEKNKQLVGLLEHYINEVKMQLDSVNEKTDRSTEQGHNIHTKLDKLFDFVQGDVVCKIAAQEKKAESLEQNVQELKHMVQKLVEQKTSGHHVEQPPTSMAPFPTPTPAPGFSLPVHRSQPSLTNYYGSPMDMGREAPPPLPQPMPHNMDHRDAALSGDGRNDGRMGFGGGYGQQWGPRGYQVRNGKDERSYPGSSPFHFANGNGAFNNGYSGGYSSYNYTPTTPEHH